MGVPERDEASSAVMAAAERFCTTQGVPATTKRLLYEYLAYPGPNGRSISGLCAPGTAPSSSGAADLEGITRKFVGFHIIKHYFKMRQYNEASGVVANFLRYLRSEGTLPAATNAKVDAALKAAEAGCEELPHIMRIIRQPDARNEAYAYRYPLRPYPICYTPLHTDVKESSSRVWPDDKEQQHKSWISFAAERCRLELPEMEAVLAEVPDRLTPVSIVDGCWQVVAVQPDHTIVFSDLYGDRRAEVPFTAKRAADFRPGMVLGATFVTLSNGAKFMTDCGYVFPSFYAPHITGKEDFGPFDKVELLY